MFPNTQGTVFSRGIRIRVPDNYFFFRSIWIAYLKARISPESGGREFYRFKTRYDETFGTSQL